MEPSTVNTLISDHILKALCNTLLHSLWQGILLAVITGAIIIFTKKAKATYRHNLLVGALTLFAFGVAITFIWQLQNRPVNSITRLGNPTITPTVGAYTTGTYSSSAVSPGAKAADSIAPQAKTSGITETVINYFSTHYNIIVLIWFLIICAKSVQMAVGLHSVFHLKRTKVFAVSKDWEGRLLQLADQLHIRQTIRLLESGIAKVPMVIGHLKPVILIPIGLISSLSADEVEAILIHELAHIRRRDYLVNLLQSFMEIIFFFNPAVLWTSQLIKTERENCCDDLAIAQSRNKQKYIRALLSCEEYKAAGPNYAMAFPGSKNTLLDRVKRMVGNRNHSLNVLEKTVLAVCLVVLGLGVSAFTAREPIEKVIRKVVAAIHQDKVPLKEKAKAAATDTTKKKQLDQDRLNDVLNQLKQNQHDTLKTTGDAKPDALVHNADSLRGNNNLQLTLNAQRSGLNGNQVLLNNNFNSSLSLLAKQDTNTQKTLKQTHDIGQELYREHWITDTNHLSITTHLDKRELIVNGVRMPDDVYQRIYTKFYKKGENGGSYGINYKNGSSYGIDYKDRYGPSGAQEPPAIIVPDFGDTLVKYGVIKDKRHIHAIFNSHGLIINGVKQPDDVFQMLYKKYATGPDANVNITYTNNGLPDTRMEQNAYWAGQQRKIIDQMQREGLINNRKDLSFTLTDKTFVINGMVQTGDVFERYRHEYIPADAGDNWTWNYPGPPGYYPAYANGYRNSGEYYRRTAAERQRLEAERDKVLVADLLQDGLITDPNNVTFTLSNKKLEINGKKQSAELYQKYKEKYVPNDSGGDWSWTYQHHK
ncbi:MAG TPA: M56 family metallopeptidase [Mucilaginibacter sp.]|jgi:beta-lactamase regulating signal transducer with metallopeptidase domain|nr:M56 family metallopeptidase [Mucilaginibacter sp.]